MHAHRLSVRYRWVSDTWHLHERPLHQLWGLLPLRVPTRPGCRCGWSSVCGHTHADYLLRCYQDGHVLTPVPRCSDQVGVLLCQSRTWLWGALPTLSRQKLRYRPWFILHLINSYGLKMITLPEAKHSAHTNLIFITSFISAQLSSRPCAAVVLASQLMAGVSRKFESNHSVAKKIFNIFWIKYNLSQISMSAPWTRISARTAFVRTSGEATVASATLATSLTPAARTVLVSRSEAVRDCAFQS